MYFCLWKDESYNLPICEEWWDSEYKECLQMSCGRHVYFANDNNLRILLLIVLVKLVNFSVYRYIKTFYFKNTIYIVFYFFILFFLLYFFRLNLNVKLIPIPAS